MDILWCYLIVCLDFFNKKSTNNLNFLQMTKHNSIIISILKIFSRFNYINTDLYKSQKKVFTSLMETYFDKYKDELTRIEFINFVKALVSLDIHSYKIFSSFYKHKII